MKQLQVLHEEFIEKARRPMTFGRLPINAKEVELPVVPMNKWTKEGDPKALKKTYKFRRPDDRNNFIRELLEYEEEVEHNADISISEDSVTLKIYTKDIKQITEIDTEYAKFADSLYKDITIIPDKFSNSSTGLYNLNYEFYSRFT